MSEGINQCNNICKVFRLFTYNKFANQKKMLQPCKSQSRLFLSFRLLASRQVQAESNFTDFFSQDDAAFFL